jgi:hypothetical protein
LIICVPIHDHFNHMGYASIVCSSRNLAADRLGIKRPIPYARVGSAVVSSRNASGINFSFGGSGVFPTASYCPNVSTQIAQLQSLVRSRQVPRKLIDASVAFLSVNGNDYSQYLADGGSLQVPIC